MNQQRTLRTVAAVLAVVVLVGCAAQKAYRRAERDGERSDWDAAVLGYSKALALSPGNSRYNVALERAKLKGSAQHFEKGKRYASGSQWELAVAEFQQALLLNPGNQHAATELDKAIRQIQRVQGGPSELERLKTEAKRRALAPPKLAPGSNIPINLNFREVPVGKIFEAIGKASGINFLFDDKTDVKRPLTVDIGNISLEKALDILMLQTKNFYKVIDESTLLIAPDNRQKRQEYEDQVIRTFYLSNGDPKQVVTLLRSLLQSRQIAENTALNSVTIKDTPDKAAIAERIIDSNDKSKGEVVVDVELLEINRTVAQNLGIDLSSKTLSLTFRDGLQSVPLNNLRILKQQGNWTIGVIPSVILNFLKSDTESKTIAQPQVRVSEGEKAEILIGDRVPIPTTSFNTSQTVGGNIVPITSFTYQNVGITVQIEPRVHHNQEVTLKVSVEVSALAGSVQTGAGQAQPIIGTRNIQTVIRLRDGETNLLAGLIKRDQSHSKSGIPGLLDIPGVNRVFGNTNSTRTDTDIVLTLTPHIIRIPDITEEDLSTLWVGTEDNMQLRGPTRGLLGESPFATPAEEPVTAGVAPGEASAAPPAEAPSKGGSVTIVPPSPAQGAPPPEAEPSGGEEVEPAGEQPEEVPEEPPPTTPEEPRPQDRTGQPPKPPNAPAVVRVVPSAPSYRVGDVITLEVRIENATSVGSVPFHIKYNPGLVQFVPPGAEGSFMSSDGTGTIFLASDTPGAGEVVVGLSRMGGGTGVSGSGTLATFNFHAAAGGRATFMFTGASVKDPQARNLPASFIAAAVGITQ